MKTELKRSTTNVASLKIPQNWEVLSLGDIAASVISGFASGARADDGVVQLRMNNVTTDGRIVLDSYLKVPAPANLREYFLQPGDLLVNNTNSIDLVGKSAVFRGAPFPCVFSNHFTRLRLDTARAMPDWVLWQLVRMWRSGFFRTVAIRHVGQAAVRTDEILGIRISLPPINEQQKALEPLSYADAAVQKTDQIITELELFKKGLIQRLLSLGIRHTKVKETGAGKIPKDWQLIPLGEICEKPVYGFTASASSDPIGPRLLRITDIKDQRVNWKTVPYCRCDKPTLDRLLLRDGDVVVARIGATTGKAYMVKGAPSAVFASYLIRIRTGPSLTPEFLNYFFQSEGYWKQVSQNKGGRLKGGLNTAQLRTLLIPLPSLSEQKRIVLLLSEVDDKLEKERARRDASLDLKRGFMQQLLTGKMRVKV